VEQLGVYPDIVDRVVPNASMDELTLLESLAACTKPSASEPRNRCVMKMCRSGCGGSAKPEKQTLSVSVPYEGSLARRILRYGLSWRQDGSPVPSMSPRSTTAPAAPTPVQPAPTPKRSAGWGNALHGNGSRGVSSRGDLALGIVGGPPAVGMTVGGILASVRARRIDFRRRRSPAGPVGRRDYSVSESHACEVADRAWADSTREHEQHRSCGRGAAASPR